MDGPGTARVRTLPAHEKTRDTWHARVSSTATSAIDDLREEASYSYFDVSESQSWPRSILCRFEMTGQLL